MIDSLIRCERVYVMNVSCEFINMFLGLIFLL